MHNTPAQKTWTATVEPGHTADFRVIYKPRLMPPEGFIANTVEINTNDPHRRVVELAIHAAVR